jgi:hypothetical protein
LIQWTHININKQLCDSNKTLNNVTLSRNDDGILKCPKAFDGILCWEETLAGTIASKTCPEWFIGFYSKGNARRHCRKDGTWELRKDKSGKYINQTYTNYTECLIHPKDEEAESLKVNSILFRRI